MYTYTATLIPLSMILLVCKKVCIEYLVFIMLQKPHNKATQTKLIDSQAFVNKSCMM